MGSAHHPVNSRVIATLHCSFAASVWRSRDGGVGVDRGPLTSNLVLGCSSCHVEKYESRIDAGPHYLHWAETQRHSEVPPRTELHVRDRNQTVNRHQLISNGCTWGCCRLQLPVLPSLPLCWFNLELQQCPSCTHGSSRSSGLFFYTGGIH